MKKSIAFTLAEVLLTIGLIGVVAALTMPGVVAQYKRQVAIGQLKKMYSVMAQTMLFTIQKDGNYDSLEILDDSIEDWYTTTLKPYIKTTKECFNETGCWATSGTKLLNGGTPHNDNGSKGLGSNVVVFFTSDGYSVNIAAVDESMNDLLGVDNTVYVLAYVDINGIKAPNVFGKDIFMFVFTDKGIMPAGRDLTDDEIESDCSASGNGYYCFEKIIRDGWNINKESLWW